MLAELSGGDNLLDAGVSSTAEELDIRWMMPSSSSQCDTIVSCQLYLCLSRRHSRETNTNTVYLGNPEPRKRALKVWHVNVG